MSDPIAATGAAPSSENATQSSNRSKSLLETALAGAIALTKNAQNLDAANEQFTAVLNQVKVDSPEVAPLLQLLWSEYTSAQRSSTFYESLSDAEKGLSDKMSESNIQLQRNYMRLVQEQ